jgi:hypothetical protein
MPPQMTLVLKTFAATQAPIVYDCSRLGIVSYHVGHARLQDTGTYGGIVVGGLLPRVGLFRVAAHASNPKGCST